MSPPEVGWKLIQHELSIFRMPCENCATCLGALPPSTCCCHVFHMFTPAYNPSPEALPRYRDRTLPPEQWRAGGKGVRLSWRLFPCLAETHEVWRAFPLRSMGQDPGPRPLPHPSAAWWWTLIDLSPIDALPKRIDAFP